MSPTRYWVTGVMVATHRSMADTNDSAPTGTAAIEERTHVFILRIWCEPREIAGATAEWRATVEHVGSGERRHVRALGEIEPTIARYLGEHAGRSDRYGSLRRWLAKWKRT